MVKGRLVNQVAGLVYDGPIVNGVPHGIGKGLSKIGIYEGEFQGKKYIKKKIKKFHNPPKYPKLR